MNIVFLMYVRTMSLPIVHKKHYCTGPGRGQQKSRAALEGEQASPDQQRNCNASNNLRICRKWTFSSQRVCALIPAWRGMGDPLVVSPIECEGQQGLALC